MLIGLDFIPSFYDELHSFVRWPLFLFLCWHSSVCQVGANICFMGNSCGTLHIIIVAHNAASFPITLFHKRIFCVPSLKSLHSVSEVKIGTFTCHLV